MDGPHGQRKANLFCLETFFQSNSRQNETPFQGENEDHQPCKKNKKKSWIRVWKCFWGDTREQEGEIQNSDGGGNWKGKCRAEMHEVPWARGINQDGHLQSEKNGSISFPLGCTAEGHKPTKNKSTKKENKMKRLDLNNKKFSSLLYACKGFWKEKPEWRYGGTLIKPGVLRAWPHGMAKGNHEDLMITQSHHGFGRQQEGHCIPMGDPKLRPKARTITEKNTMHGAWCLMGMWQDGEKKTFWDKTAKSTRDTGLQRKKRYTVCSLPSDLMKKSEETFRKLRKVH